jgi:hypothetical protein
MSKFILAVTLTCLISCASTSTPSTEPSIEARVEGDIIILKSLDAYTLTCKNDLDSFQKKSSDGHLEEVFNSVPKYKAHVLDGKKVPVDSAAFLCDVAECAPLEMFPEIPLPRYKQVGVDAYKTESDTSGHYRLEHTYYADKNCQQKKLFVFEFDLGKSAR